MPLILLVVALAFPRTVVILLWLFSTWWSAVALDWLVAVIAFLFMPYTLLWYSVVVNVYGGVWGLWQMLFLVVAVLLDLVPLFTWKSWHYVEDAA